MKFYSDSMGYQWDIPFGKRLQETMERSTIFDG